MVQRLAAGEAAVNRRALAQFYAQDLWALGEQRYDFLGRLAELERVCTNLERLVQTAATGEERGPVLRARLSSLALQGVEARQEARALAGVLPCRAPAVPGYARSGRLRRISGVLPRTSPSRRAPAGQD